MARTTLPTQKKIEQPSAVVTSLRIFIKLAEVKVLTTLSTSEIYRRIAAGTFPRQVALGPKSVVWIESEILAWCDDCIRVSRKNAA
ncbi:AlpA family transcriptional regulator [Pseudomonas sp.]|uniref:helix-turn-helix transcriptional regulator n=1 Tax=Pseudomonas sp. TaxID=306 RepID=UPI0027300CCE|nr:AlpA family phage regulatory protein [Pseudomonas sp.]MDP2243504.1 AlpA family phage regulatory protein [Pseudomonas sp.]